MKRGMGSGQEKCILADKKKIKNKNKKKRKRKRLAKDSQVGQRDGDEVAPAVSFFSRGDQTGQPSRGCVHFFPLLVQGVDVFHQVYLSCPL